ncbi:MAG: RHS repeat-associated core domain-containing protein [Bacteroidota bacterium]
MLTKYPLYYHSFGAPMATRNKQVSSVLVTKTVSESSFSSGVDGWVATSNATLSNVYGNIRATVTALNAGMQKTFSTEAGKTYRIMFKVNLRGWPYMYVKDVASTTNLISITDFMTPGDYSYIFTATGFETNIIFHEAGNPSGSVQLASFTLEEVDAENGYRFGFNGMEKTDEMYGDGSEYSTEFRQYDARLGRWMSIDPMSSYFPWQSPYAAFDNNPILIKDPKGLAGESSNADPDKKMKRQTKRFEKLKAKLADKYGEGSDKYNSELARIGSRRRYGSSLVFHQKHSSPQVSSGSTGSINRDFALQFDNTKATYQSEKIMGGLDPLARPNYVAPGEVAGEVSFEVKVTDGQKVFLSSATTAGLQVEVLVNGQSTYNFSEAPQPAWDEKKYTDQDISHPKLVEYKSIAINTGSSSPQIVVITFKATYTNVGSKIHYRGYAPRLTAAKVSVGTISN